MSNLAISARAGSARPRGTGPAAGARILVGLSKLARFAARVLGVIGVWLARARSRRALLHLDDRMLRDIGLCRADARAEAAKHFWRE
jgi:uncharacterized protein YjiS (DUF1127 family)